MIGLLALGLAGGLAAAQPADIIVTGRGLPAPAGEEAFGAVEIPAERLAGSASSRLEDVLRDVPGFQLFRRSDARSANPTSQGATLRALGGNASSRALLLLDGVPQTDPFGGWVSWPAYDPRRLGSARITRGGGSGVAGPGALAGTIELESAGPGDAGNLRLSAAGGSRESLDAFAALGQPLGAGHVSVSGSYARGEGFAPVVPAQQGLVDRPAPYEQASLSLRAVAPLGRDVELQAAGLWFSDKRERGTAFSDIASSGADASLRLVGQGALPWSLLGYVQTRAFANSFASVSADRASVTQASEQYNVPSTGLGARAEVRPRLGAASLRLGADWRETSGVTRELYSFVGGVGTRGREAGGRSRTIGAFAEASLPLDAVTLTVGGRIDHWRILSGSLDERVLATGQLLTADRYPDRTGWEPTGRAGVAWRAGEGVTLRAATYRGWRLPTLNELYRPFRLGPDATAANPDLAPERLEGAEAGLEWRPAQGARLSLTAFHNRLEGAIANVTLGAGPGTFPGVGFVGPGGVYRQRGNLDAVTSRGIEIDAEYRTGAFSIRAGYSFVDARVSASGAATPLDDLRPAQTPRHSGAVSLGWEGARGAAASLALRYVGEQYEDDLNLVSLPDALTLDASAILPLSRRLAIELRAENVTDTLVVAAISGAGIVERATPRTLWVGLRFTG